MRLPRRWRAGASKVSATSATVRLRLVRQTPNPYSRQAGDDHIHDHLFLPGQIQAKVAMGQHDGEADDSDYKLAVRTHGRLPFQWFFPFLNRIGGRQGWRESRRVGRHDGCDGERVSGAPEPSEPEGAERR